MLMFYASPFWAPLIIFKALSLNQLSLSCLTECVSALAARLSTCSVSQYLQRVSVPAVCLSLVVSFGIANRVQACCVARLLQAGGVQACCVARLLQAGGVQACCVARMLQAGGVQACYVARLLQAEFKPVKLFSIDRVFRNENLDATHLADFHQIEGVVADRGMS